MESERVQVIEFWSLELNMLPGIDSQYRSLDVSVCHDQGMMMVEGKVDLADLAVGVPNIQVKEKLTFPFGVPDIVYLYVAAIREKDSRLVVAPIDLG